MPTEESTLLVSSESHTANDGSDADNLVTLCVEETDPLIPNARKCVTDDTVRTASHTYLRVPGVRRPLKESSSDIMLESRIRHRESTTDSAQTSFCVGDLRNDQPDEGLMIGGIPSSLQSPCQALRRSTSNSGVELRSRYHDPTVDSATLQQQLILQTKHTGEHPLRPCRVRRVRTANGPFHWTNPQSPRPGFMWFSSKPDPASILQLPSEDRMRCKSRPLRSSMKRKSKSATTTPPSSATTGYSTPKSRQHLRRMKTVDFEDTFSEKLLPLPPFKLWSSEPNRTTMCEAGQYTSHLSKSEKVRSGLARGAPSCLVPTTKSRLADPAVTRTDVHVVAIAPSWYSDDIADEGGINPATPTMQIVESKNGCYEVIWDDVPNEHDIRLHRQKSSASEALQTIGSSTAKGLARVNSKLTEWTWCRKLSPFKPQVVVFPDDDGRELPVECAVEEGDVLVLVPPNSERTSASPSRLPSQPSTARPSKSGSYEEPQIEIASSKSDPSIEPQGGVATLVMPDPEASSGTPAGAIRKTKQPPAVRRLSNMEESEIRFRCHRDSVTLARSRILNAGGVSPELFMHRDSVSIAKKRMHARNHAVSHARVIPRQENPASEPLSPFKNFTQSSRSPPPRAVKDHAAKALKSSDSASILHPQATTMKRHIRIVE